MNSRPRSHSTSAISHIRGVALIATCLLLSTLPALPAGEFLVVGVDRKVAFTTEGLKRQAPGRDRVLIFEIGENPLEPKPVADLELMNSVFGPPTNLAITPDGTLALVANSVLWEESNGEWLSPPDRRIHVIDLTGNAPRKIGEATAGAQPSGMAISADGSLCAVANRAGKSVSFLSIQGKRVTTRHEVRVEGEAAAIAIAPDGQTILATKFAEHAVAVIRRDSNGTPHYDVALDVAVGRWPYNVQITPDGRLALVANNGKSGFPDGHVDTVTVIDLQADPPRAIDHVTVGDGPEGLTISPDGRLAVVALLQGSAPIFDGQWFQQRTGSATLLSIDSARVERTGQIQVGRFAEGMGFSKDGRYLYIGDLLDDSVSIWAVNGSSVTSTGRRIDLPGHAASLRTQVP